MPTLVLTDPVNNTITDANVISNNNTAIKNIINGGITNDNISGSAAIQYAKLNLTTGILNGDINSAAAISVSKLAPSVTNGHVLTTTAGVAVWASPTLTIGTSLPASPVNGDQYTLVDSTTAPTYAWTFQYSTAVSDANKWVFTGGSPLQSEVDGSTAISSGSYTTLNCTVTAPRGGIYTVEYGCAVDTPGNDEVIVSVSINGGTPSDADGIYTSHYGSTAETSMRSRRMTITSGHTLALYGKLIFSHAGGVVGKNLRIALIPVRVA